MDYPSNDGIAEMRILSPKDYDKYMDYMGESKSYGIVGYCVSMAAPAAWCFYIFIPQNNEALLYVGAICAVLGAVSIIRCRRLFAQATDLVDDFHRHRTKKREEDEKDMRDKINQISESDALAAGRAINSGNFENISNSVINFAPLSNATISNQVGVSEEALNEAFDTLRGFVAASGSEEAASQLKQLQKAVEDGADKSAVARAWTGLVAALPSVTSMAKAADAIMKVFT